MLGSTSLFALILLVAGPNDAGMATISDETPAIGVMAADDMDQAEPVNYIAPMTKGESGERGNTSLLQAMLQDQDTGHKKASPFKDEGSEPGEAIAEPTRRLPPVPANAPQATGNNNSPDTAIKNSPWAGYGECKTPDCAVPSCNGDTCSTDSCQPKKPKGERFAFCNWFRDIDYEGWVDQGVTINPFSPRDRSNYPVAFNNRSNEYQLNQAYLRLKRDVDRQGCHWDVGGTVDLLYGTDSFYASSRGLEVTRGFGPKWNAQDYGLAMPQCYMEVFAPWGDDGATMKLGHFYTNLGYETTTAPDNFFYSHSFCIIYGEPVTETGVLAEKKFGNWKIQGGFSRGWDNWEDNNNNLSFIGGLSWIAENNRSSVAFAIQSGPEQNEPPKNTNDRTVLSVVYQQKLGSRYQYVIQYDYGQENRDDFLAPQRPAEWTGLNQYLFYTINDSWKAGMRFEWFRDRDGVRFPHGNLQSADYYELSTGLNWTPHSRVVVRPEFRYDWVGTPNVTPYVDSSKSYQLIVDCDVIVKF